jgi:deoxyribose-phosphate aldolase
MPDASSSQLPDYASIASLIDHALLAPNLTSAEADHGLALARAYRVASVCIVPSYVSRAREGLEGSGVRVGTVIGFPHGGQALDTKARECEYALRDGAEELDVVVNLHRVLSDDLAYVKRELALLTAIAHAGRGKIKIIFENCYLEERHKIRLCELCGQVGADWVKTSTGFGPSGATLPDLALMRRHTPPAVGVKASGGLRDLETVLAMRPYVTRCGASRTREILDELRRRLGLPAIAL